MGKRRFLHMRRETDNIFLRILAHAPQDIDQAGVDINAVEFAVHDQALDEPDLLGTGLGPGKNPITLSQRDGTRRPLKTSGSTGISGAERNPCRLTRHSWAYFNALTPRVAGYPIQPVALRSTPVPEGPRDRFAVFRAIGKLLLALEVWTVFRMSLQDVLRPTHPDSTPTADYSTRCFVRSLMARSDR
ncbi:MAG: hypothetical protein ACYDBH_02695 [Acidobacteriaceae bacterium]